MKYLLAMLCFAATSVAADGLEIRFADGNPHDRFWIKNVGCPLEDATLLIDMRSAIAGVLMDTVRGGIGTKDPMPVEIEEGEATLLPIRDGSQLMILQLPYLKTGGQVTVTLDVDDAASAGFDDRVEVDGSELHGARVTVLAAGGRTTATFDARGLALPQTPPPARNCLVS